MNNPNLTKEKKLENTLNKIYEFIMTLENIKEISEKDKPEFFFSFEDKGALFLNGDDLIRYRETLSLIYEVVDKDIISLRETEKIFQKAILSTIDFGKKRQDKNFKERLENAIQDFRKSILSEPFLHSVYYPVEGLAIDGLPIKVGNVTFCIFNEENVNNFNEIIKANNQNEKIGNYFLELLKEIPIIGKTIGLIEVKAIDTDAAKTAAVKELSLTIDRINFYSDLIPYQSGYIYLPSESQSIAINVPIMTYREKPNLKFGFERVGPLMLLSLPKLLEIDKKRNIGFSKVNNLLHKKRNDLEEKIISAVQWAGKATIENKREEAFLLYAISLESLILLDNKKDEIISRFRTRVAHLLGKSIKERKEISKRMNDLYDTRSKIVHSGWYKVTDADLSLMRIYTKRSILRILNEEPFISMKSKDDLIEWFNT